MTEQSRAQQILESLSKNEGENKYFGVNSETKAIECGPFESADECNSAIEEGGHENCDCCYGSVDADGNFVECND